jgi:hypothetical protein
MTAFFGMEPVKGRRAENPKNALRRLFSAEIIDVSDLGSGLIFQSRDF